LTASFPQAGYWDVTLQASASYTDTPCTDTWAGSGTVDVIVQVIKGEAVQGIVVVASAGTPSPGCLGDSTSTALTASVQNPPTSQCTINGPTWWWTIQSVQYSTDNSTWGPSPGGDEAMIVQP
jgi:hypothetical protein